MAQVLNRTGNFANQEKMQWYNKVTIISAIVYGICMVIFVCMMLSRNMEGGMWMFLPTAGSGVIAKAAYGQYSRLSSGNYGERSAVSILEQLPDSYRILHNVSLSKGDKRTELDAVVISPYGIHIVEVKSHNGSIRGQKDEREWYQDKIGRAGTPYTSMMKNPIKQLGFQKYLLSDILKDYKIRVWIDGTVFMPVANQVSVDSGDVVQSGSALLCRISQETAVKLSDADLSTVITLLSQFAS